MLLGQSRVSEPPSVKAAFDEKTSQVELAALSIQTETCPNRRAALSQFHWCVLPRDVGTLTFANSWVFHKTTKSSSFSRGAESNRGFFLSTQQVAWQPPSASGTSGDTMSQSYGQSAQMSPLVVAGIHFASIRLKVAWGAWKGHI